MLNIDSDAVECDLAETYQIFNYRELPLRRVALFCVGLRDNSRIKMKMSNTKCSLDSLILANISDKISIYLWKKYGGKKPSLIMDGLIEHKNNDYEINKDVLVFNDSDEFEKARKIIINGGGINGTS